MPSKKYSANLFCGYTPAVLSGPVEVRLVIHSGPSIVGLWNLYVANFPRPIS